MNSDLKSILKKTSIIIIKLNDDFIITPHLKYFTQDVQQKITAFHKIHDQKITFTSQLLQRYYLAKLCKIHYRQLKTSTTNYHKPYIVSPNTIKCEFNVSHCQDYVVMATYMDDDYTIGVDIEQIDDKVDIYSMGQNVFSQSEINLLNNSSTNFFKLWTKKEALIKAYGTGFITDFYQNTKIDLTDCEYNPKYWIVTQQLDNYFLSVCLHKKIG